MDVAIKDGRARTPCENLDGPVAVLGRPLPFGQQREERAMRQHHEGRVLRQSSEVGREPLQLRVAKRTSRKRHIVDRYKVHALVVECVCRVAERFAVGLPPVQSCVMLAGQEANVFDLQRRRDLAEPLHAFAPFRRIVGGVGEVAGEYDEIRHLVDGIDRRDRMLERDVGLRVGRSLKAPVRVRQLKKEEVFVGGGRSDLRAGGACCAPR